jgi:hypothetical protein
MRKLAFWRRARRSPFFDGEQTYALALTMAGIVLVTIATVAILIRETASEPARRAHGQSSVVGPASVLGPPTDQDPQPRLDVAEYVNGTLGYGFEYPKSWTVRESAQVTALENPNGRIRVVFGIGPSGDLDTAASRVIDSLSDVASDRELIGMTHETIDGSRSLLVSGTATDDSGRRVRFLAITVRGEPKNYAISIFVPRESDPVRVLPRIEEIVSSFDVLRSGGELAA